MDEDGDAVYVVVGDGNSHDMYPIWNADNNIGDDFGIYVYSYALFLNQLTQWQYAPQIASKCRMNG